MIKPWYVKLVELDTKVRLKQIHKRKLIEEISKEFGFNEYQNKKLKRIISSTWIKMK